MEMIDFLIWVARITLATFVAIGWNWKGGTK